MFLRHTLLIFLLLAGAGSLHAQDALLESLYDKIAASCVRLEYSYSSEVSGVKMKGSGVLLLQDSMWHNEGNGLEIWCDGKTVWTADMFSEELIIDSAADDGNNDFTNPALMFVRMNELFRLRKALDGRDGLTRIYVLEPKADIGMEYFNVEVLKSDLSIRSASFAMDDGSEVKLAVSAMSFMEKKPATAFRPSQTFDSSWIVTDLR